MFPEKITDRSAGILPATETYGLSLVNCLPGIT
jgi:hypothetical protein